MRLCERTSFHNGSLATLVEKKKKKQFLTVEVMAPSDSMQSRQHPRSHSWI